MRTREMLLCAAGSIFNDLSKYMFSFSLLFLMEVVELSAVDTGLIILIGQIVDALTSVISGYLGDMVKVPVLSQKIGMRKSWHLLATVFMGIVVPLCINRCILCGGRHQTWLPTVYYAFLYSLYNMCFSVVEINHLAFITTSAGSVEERTDLSAIRTMFSFLSGIYIYVIAWGLFGQDNSDTLGPQSLPDFVHLSWIATGTGLFFAAIFHIGTKEPQQCQNKESATTDCTKASEKFIEDFVPENANSRRTSLAFKFTNMVMASTEYEEHQNEMDGNGETKSHELRVRKRSLLQKFAVAMFADGKTDLEVQHFDSERKKSLRTLDFDDILLRLQHEEHEQPTCFGAMENQVTMDGIADDHSTDEESWNARQGEIKNTTEKGMWKMTISAAPKTSFCIVPKQRKYGMVLFPDDGKFGLSNSGFEDDGGDDDKKESLCGTSVRKQRKSVTFDPSGFLEMPPMNGTERQELKLDHTPDNKTSLDESMQDFPKQPVRKIERIEGCDGTNNSVTSADNPDLLGVPVQSTSSISEGRRPKGIKNWLKDPNVYMVAIIFTCTRLAQDSVNSYLPLFLTERLSFPKAATAYFPLVLLTSGSLASSTCKKLKRKIGSKWSYLLASLLVMGGAVWSYFQTFSIRQSTYAPVVMIGSGLSIMYVMALVFITELIGENRETSGSVFSIITVIARISKGALIIGIQEFYPEERTSSNEAVSNYVRHVFVMAPGVLTLVGFLLVLFFQPSNFICKSKVSEDVEALHGQSSFDVQVNQCPSGVKATSGHSLDDSHNTSIVVVDSCSEDSKL
ncbi:uncharacterized protein [Pocillopora verrucosa]|uniref:uncharacterized protein n=1 Tax=Pocillopora verrucosa TaxID=203993 RepID=UPI00333F0029